MYFPGMKAVVQGDIPFLDSEIPAANGVTTARGLAKMYAAIANGGRIDGTQFLSQELVAGLTGRPSLLAGPKHLRAVELPPGLSLGAVPAGVHARFRPRGPGGSVGWADPASGLSFAFVHNRLLTRMVLDQATFAGLHALDPPRRRGRPASAVIETTPAFGAPYDVPRPVRRLTSGIRQRLARVNHLVLMRQDCADVNANPAPHPQAKIHTSVPPSIACSGGT